MNMSGGLRFALCVPTLNAGSLWFKWLRNLTPSARLFDELLIIDSSSDDETVPLARQAGFDILTIPRHEFDHGGTRQLAVDSLPRSDVIVFLTQDAVIASGDAIGILLKAFNDESVGLAYGRQLPRADAGLVSAHARYFNYQPKSETRTFGSRSYLGLKAAFCSNSFAAYRRRALVDVGGFPSNMIFGEDMVVAGKMLINGWRIAYQAEACVYHSHDYSLRQEFRRYFDIGVLHCREAWLLETFGKPEGEGIRFLKSELVYLWKRNPSLIPTAIFRTALKYLGYRLGRLEAHLPSAIKPTLSMHSNYWGNE